MVKSYIVLISLFLFLSSCSSDDNSFEKNAEKILEFSNWTQDGNYIMFNKNNEILDIPYLNNECKSTFSFEKRTGKIELAAFENEDKTNCFLSPTYITYIVRQEFLVIEYYSGSITFKIKKITKNRLELTRHENNTGNYLQMNYNRDYK